MAQSHILHLYMANASVTAAKPYRGNEREATGKPFLSLNAHIWLDAAACAESSSQVWDGVTGTVYLQDHTIVSNLISSMSNLISTTYQQG